MKLTILVENTAENSLESEWGLSIYTEFNKRKCLVDVGASGKFLHNAQALGINISDVDAVFLSHAHYDHVLGLDEFFRVNSKAKVYIRETAAENCYSKHGFIKVYIGLRRGILEEYKNRIIYTGDCTTVDDGIYLLAHDTPELERIGKKSHMYTKVGGHYQVESFTHEQNIVFRSDKGLVIVSPCSHAGAGNIVREVQRHFKGEKIAAIIGGFHLYGQSAGYVREFARQLLDTGAELVYTGHCTGKKAIGILREEMCDMNAARVREIETGMVIDI